MESLSASFLKYPGYFSVFRSILTMQSFGWSQPPISKSSHLLTKPFGIVPSARITRDITVTFMFHCNFISLETFKYLPLFSLSLIFTWWSPWTAKFAIWQVFHYYYFSPLSVFLTSPSHRSSSDSKSPQVFSNLLSILADFNNVVVGVISTCPFVSKSSSSCTNPLVSEPRAPIGITFTLMFHIFFCSQARSRHLSFFSFSFNFTLWSGRRKSPISLLFFVDYHSVWSRLGDTFVFQNPREVCAFQSPGQIPGCVCTICSYSQISISCTIPSGSPCPLSRI